MPQYKDEARELLDLVGGKENINASMHCATRVRFVLNDDSKADVDKIEALPSVKGTFTQAGQFQVIIGNQVSDFYKDFQAVSGVEEVSKDQVKDAGKQNQNWFQKALTFLSDVFTPIIPAFIVGGLILGFRNVLEGIPFEALGGLTIVETSQFWAGVNSFLWLPGEAIFHFLPVYITWSTVKKMGGIPVMGIILGITLVSPQLLNAYDAPTALIEGTVPQWDFGAFQIDMIGYQAQVLPALFTGVVYGWLERFWRKHVPEYVSMIFVPFLSLLPAIILAHTVLGPVGWQIGTWIGSVVYAALTSSFSWLFGLIFGTFYSPLVITGLHHMTNAVDAQLIADFGGTMLWPMIAYSNIAQGSAVLGYWWLTRKDENENQITIPSIISAYLGVTEPAMFGVTLKHVYPFVAAMIGSGLAGLLSTTMQVTANSIGVGGLPGFLVIQPQSMVWFFVGMAISIVVPLVLTIAFKKAGIFVKAEDKTTSQEIAEDAGLVTATATAGAASTSVFDTNTAAVRAAQDDEGNEAIVNVAEGEVIAIDAVEDETFSQKLMGDGYGVRPTTRNVVSPVVGKVVSVFPTKHAIGIQTDSGVDVLVHLGLDTVELNGDPFEVLVQEGAYVDLGTPIATMDLEKVEAAGKSTTIVVAFTNFDNVAEFDIENTGTLDQTAPVGHFKAK